MIRALPLTLLLAGCSSAPDAPHVSAAERGAQLFESDAGVTFACATCHPGALADESRIYPGADLHGATKRASFWGGQVNDLLRAVNDCRSIFQGAGDELSADEPDAVDLYAFLVSLDGPGEAVPFGIVRSVSDLPSGRASRGAAVYDQACRTCHGELHTGDGAVGAIAPALPEHPLLEHATYPEDQRRLIFVEKVRHGAFLGYSGVMPPFSSEVLSDRDLSDLLSFFELY